MSLILSINFLSSIKLKEAWMFLSFLFDCLLEICWETWFELEVFQQSLGNEGHVKD